MIGVGVLIAALHYLFFLGDIKDKQSCYFDLLKAQYDNQNLLTEQFYEKRADPAAIDQVFKDHFTRLEGLNKRFVCGQ